MPKTWRGRSIFWFAILGLLPVIWRIYSGQPQAIKSEKAARDTYQKCMNQAETAFQVAISSNDANQWASYLDSYNVDGIMVEQKWSIVVTDVSKYCERQTLSKQQ
jgi:hypothetical protein